MRRLFSLLAFLAFTIAGTAAAQTTETPPAPQAVTPAVPFQVTTVPATVVPLEDSRLAACAAPTLPNFLPYTVRSGDTLSHLLIGSNTVTPSQLASLNCLESDTILPVGATIWLPNDAFQVSLVPISMTALETATVDSNILSFTASATALPNDQSVTLTWQAEGRAAFLYTCPQDENCVRPVTSPPLPLSGSITVGNFHEAGDVVFRLEVSSAESVAQDVSVEVICAQEWLGGIGASPRCPEDPPRTVTAVWQPFEGGVMMWFSDIQQIYVMTNAGGRVRVFTDSFVEGMPNPTDSAPEGRLTPIRGFGQVWAALGGAQESGLGWAMSPEIGFDSARQPAGRTSYTTYVQGPGETVYAITEIPGMELSYWAQIAG